MRFSILTPSFNQAAFLERNIASVLSQDVPGTEHIIIDGGSTDGTVGILKQYDSRLHYWVSEKDNGQADALNKGLAKATGEIVGWCNVDEYYEPRVFGAVQEAFERNPEAAVVYGHYRRVLPDGREIRINRSWRFDYEVCRVQTPIITNCGAFFRRDRLVGCGGFDASWQYLMDWELYIRLMRGAGWVRLPRVLGNFTMHEQSKTARAQEGFRREIDRLYAREFPGMSRDAIDHMRHRQIRRMVWHMLLDGVLMEKAWFKLVRQRHYAAYFGDPGVQVPVITRLINWISPASQA